MRGAVVASWQRCSLAGLSLARRRLAPAHASVEQPGLELRLDERDGGRDPLAYRPSDLRLRGDGEVASDVVEERPVRPREVVRVLGQARHRLLALAQHGSAELEPRVVIHVRVDQILDAAINGSRVLIHTCLGGVLRLDDRAYLSAFQKACKFLLTAD